MAPKRKAEVKETSNKKVKKDDNEEVKGVNLMITVTGNMDTKDGREWHDKTERKAMYTKYWCDIGFKYSEREIDTFKDGWQVDEYIHLEYTKKGEKVSKVLEDMWDVYKKYGVKFDRVDFSIITDTHLYHHSWYVFRFPNTGAMQNLKQVKMLRYKYEDDGVFEKDVKEGIVSMQKMDEKMRPVSKTLREWKTDDKGSLKKMLDEFTFKCVPQEYEEEMRTKYEKMCVK